MENKILEAVKALGGDLGNVSKVHGDKSLAMLVEKSEYVKSAVKLKDLCVGEYILSNVDKYSLINEFEYICYTDEFKSASEQWIKEAYMHNAAIDCDWDLYYRDGSELICTSDDIVVHFGVDVCLKQEFINYCEANKPKQTESIEWDGKGLPPIGSKIIVRNDENYILSEHGEMFIGIESTLVSIFKNANDEPMSAVSLDDGECCCFRADMIKPIKSPRDKAIEAMQEHCRQGGNKLVVGLCGELYDAGYRKLTDRQIEDLGL